LVGLCVRMALGTSESLYFYNLLFGDHYSFIRLGTKVRQEVLHAGQKWSEPYLWMILPLSSSAPPSSLPSSGTFGKFATPSCSVLTSPPSLLSASRRGVAFAPTARNQGHRDRLLLCSKGRLLACRGCEGGGGCAGKFDEVNFRLQVLGIFFCKLGRSLFELK
jgi:hypothetical protein